MSRQTSIETYTQIKSEGLLSKLRLRVYEILYKNGPMTAQEAWHIYRDKFNAKGRDGITQRFSELERLDVVYSPGKRACKITGRNCLIWDVTSNLPKKLEKKERQKCLLCNGKGYTEV